MKELCKREHFLIILIYFYFVIFGNWMINLTSPDEGKNAFAVLNMLKTKNFLIPYYNCEPRFEKPPMLYWLGAINAQIFGLTEFSLRLVSGISAGGFLFFSYLIIKKFFDSSFASKCSLVLLSFPHFWIEARSFVPEMLLNFFSIGGIYFFIENKAVWGWIFLAFAVLTKGPVGFILPLIVLCFFKISRKEFKIYNPLGIFIFLVIASSWYIYMLYQFGYLYFYKFFIKENLFRYTGEKLYHPQPFYFYLILIFLTSFCYIPAYYKILIYLKTFYPLNKEKVKKLVNQPIFPFVFWFLFILFFYSISKNKVHHYILFAYPPLSVLLSNFLSQTYIKRVLVFLGIFLFIIIIGIYSYEKKRFLPQALNFLKFYQGEIYFYKTEISSIPFYLNRCISKLTFPSNLVQGIVITEKKYEKFFINCTKLIDAKEFEKSFILLNCKSNF